MRQGFVNLITFCNTLQSSSVTLVLILGGFGFGFPCRFWGVGLRSLRVGRCYWRWRLGFGFGIPRISVSKNTGEEAS